MGFERAFVQEAIEQPTGSTVEWPNTINPTEATILGTTPVLIAVNRPGLNRRKFIIENDGTSPVIFAMGGTTVLTSSRKLGVLNPGDAYIDDYPAHQGEWSAALPSGGLPPGALNIFEGLVII